MKCSFVCRIALQAEYGMMQLLPGFTMALLIGNIIYFDACSPVNFTYEIEELNHFPIALFSYITETLH